MKFRILVCGCGKLGTRYLEGLLIFNCQSEIYVYDVSIDSINNSQKIIENYSNHFLHKFIFTDNLFDLPENFDLVIISTTAKNRSNLIQKLNQKFDIKNWLIEKILAQSTNEVSIIQETLKNNKNVFINTPRRIWTLYEKLKIKLNKNNPQKMSIEGDFGLACNAIHFIDLFAWLTGEELLSINCESLDNFWTESKRSDFWEVNGSITANFSKGSFLEINSKTSNEKFKITLIDSIEYFIDEDNGSIYNENNLIIREKILLQSELTPIIVDSILNKGFCNLPTLIESSKLHKPFLENLQIHWNKYNYLQGEILKIT
jgi:hypothetical protein